MVELMKVASFGVVVMHPHPLCTEPWPGPGGALATTQLYGTVRNYGVKRSKIFVYLVHGTPEVGPTSALHETFKKGTYVLTVYCVHDLYCMYLLPIRASFLFVFDSWLRFNLQVI